MNRFVSSLVALLLFVHVVVGCCWHHGHGRCAQGYEEADQAAPNHSVCSSHNGHHHAPDESSQESERDPPCEQPDCVFQLVSAQRTLDDLSLVASARLIGEVPQGLAHSAVEHAHPWMASLGYDVALPVRRHLLFSTLLI